MFRLTTLAALALIPLVASAQTLVHSVTGPTAGSQYGRVCITIPDQNADGIQDLLVGLPGYNAERGAIECLSGASLASGVSTQVLWTVAPSANPGDLFGFSIAIVGDATGDGISDYLVGQPGYDLVGNNNVGVIRLVSGSTSHTVVSLIVGGVSSVDFGPGSFFGSAIAACGDVNGDGISEVVIGAPGQPTCYMRVLNGSSLSSGGSSLAGSLTSWVGAGGNAGLGTAIVSGFDLDGDGFQEFAYSSPGFDGPSGVDQGAIDIREASPGFPSVTYYLSTIPGERLGQALDAAHDYDGDGVVDIVAGAPNSLDASGRQGGRVVVLSGARLAAGTPPYEVYTLMPGVVSQVGQLTFDTRFGTAVCASNDLNNDGVGEILVGSPDYFTGFGGTPRGVVTIFSGASGAHWTHVFGISGDLLGGSITGAFEDLDGDGFEEFVVAGPLSDAGGTDSGVLKCYRLFPVVQVAYCTGKINSLGCTPWMWASGTVSASSSSPFVVNASNFISQKTGLLFYSHQPASAPFQGGFKCTGNPTVRTALQNSGGSASGADCTGTYSYDFNARIQSGVDPTLVAGAEVFAQYWARDPASPSSTSLSNALRLLINP